MKGAIILAVIFISAYGATIPPVPVCTSNAVVCKFNEVGHNIKYTTINLGNQLVDAGSAILDDAIAKTTQIIVDGSKAVLGSVQDSLAAIGKRDLQIVSAFANIASKGKQYFQTVGQGLKDKLQSTISQIVGITNKFAQLDFVANFDSEIDNAVAEFKGKASDSVVLLQSGLKSFALQIIIKGQEVLVARSGKRGLFKNAADAIVSGVKAVGDAIAPSVQAVVDQVVDLGNVAKDQATSIVNDVTKAATDFGNKVVEETVKAVDQGVQALNDVKDAVTVIAVDTAGKVAGTVNEVIDTGKQAIDDVATAVGGIVGK